MSDAVERLRQKMDEMHQVSFNVILDDDMMDALSGGDPDMVQAVKLQLMDAVDDMVEAHKP